MPSGIRTEVTFDAASACPIAELADEADATVDSMDANVCPPDCERSVTEFTMDAAVDPDPDGDATPIFDHGATRRYRYDHGDADCPCTCIGGFGCPIARYVVRDGTLTIVFHAVDYEELRAIVAELRERFPAMEIERFVRSAGGERAADTVLVDRSRLTDRQLEVLETAYEMGYFEHPHRANASEVAAALDINPSTFREHVAAVEKKVFGAVL